VIVSRLAVSARKNWLALAVLLTGSFMVQLDTTIVNVAIPTIRTSLRAADTTLLWIVSGYSLSFGLALIPAGRLGDRYGHKRVFVAGLSLFTVASLACGLAQNDAQLITARAAQGLGGGIFTAAVTAMIQLMFADRQRAKALGMMGTTIGFSIALAPLVGGLIIQASGTASGWRLLFGVNVPIGILAVIAAILLLPTNDGKAYATTDWPGLVLLSAALVGLLSPLIHAPESGWPVWTYVSMAGGVALTGVFAVWERHLEKAGGHPLVPPHLFVHPSFTGGVLLALVHFAAVASIFFTISLLWQAGLGRTALQSGLVITPFAVGVIVGASRSGTLATRFGRTVLVVGLGMVAVGIAAVQLVLALTPPASYSGPQLAVPLSLAGIGAGLFLAPNVGFIVTTVHPEDAGAASGVISTVQRVGSALGIAIIGTVLFSTLHVHSAGRGAVALAYGHSATLAMAVSAGLCVAALLLVFTLPKQAR
jgi:EmrB/QacA subfamily drug resistance transporter